MAVPWLEYDAIAALANKWVSQYHASHSLPIPIEDIRRVAIGPLAELFVVSTEVMQRRIEYDGLLPKILRNAV